MAIRIWQPKWFKYWCDGLRIHYSTRWKYEDEGLNHIRRTHRGYIIPNDANLGIEPSVSWHVIYVLSVIIRFLLLIGVLYVSYTMGITIFLSVLLFILMIRFMPVGCNRNSIYDIIFWNWR